MRFLKASTPALLFNQIWISWDLEDDGQDQQRCGVGFQGTSRQISGFNDNFHL
jgi:hypothetical protein